MKISDNERKINEEGEMEINRKEEEVEEGDKKRGRERVRKWKTT